MELMAIARENGEYHVHTQHYVDRLVAPGLPAREAQHGLCHHLYRHEDGLRLRSSK